MPDLTPDALQAQQRLAWDTPFWAANVGKIINKRRQLVPLYPHPWQLRFDAALEEQRAAGLPMRAIVLKARKLGFSTWVAAKFLQRITQMPYQAALVIAQDTKTAGVLFEMARLMHAHLPTDQELGLGFSIRPHMVNKSFSPNGRKFMQFGERSRNLREMGRGFESLLEIDTAQTAEAGRGYTPSLVHGSEVAWWPDNGKLLGVLNSVPDEPETIVVLESTAQGFNHFQKRWKLAVEGAEDPDVGGRYVPIFAAWHEDPTCSSRFPTPEARQRFIDSIGTGPYGADEPDLVDLFGCTPEQLLWRRQTIREKADDSIEKFKQEYPATPEEAFIGSGNPVFGGILVARAVNAATAAPEPALGTLEAGRWVEVEHRGGTLLVPQHPRWVPAERATTSDLIRVWEHPVNERTQHGVRDPLPDGQYVVACDVAEGIATGDYHAIQVIDHVSKMQVAEYRSKIDRDELLVLVYMIALYYNEAWLAVEVNNQGISIAEPLVRDYRYRRNYRRRKVDTATNRVEDKIGWLTSKQTKPMMETTLSEALRDGSHGIRSLPLGRELTVYVEDDKGRHGAMQGENDDLLMSYMIGRQVAELLRPEREDDAGDRSVRGVRVHGGQTTYE